MAFLDFFKKKEEGFTVYAPVAGKVVPLSDVPDPVFAEGIMGKGIAIEPSDGKIYAPLDGTVTTLFPTGHAVGLTTKEGAELLIHIGMDTVKLEGKCFEKKVTDGAEVKKGDLLIEVDLDGVKEAGYPTITPIVVCDPKEYVNIEIKAEGQVAAGDELCFFKK